MASEDKLIERVRKRFASAGPGLVVGIGDDAAVLHAKSGTDSIVTTDAFLENVHFIRGVHAPDAVGYKALARATSDLAAMGARSSCFFLTLGMPEALSEAWLDGFLDGMARASRRFGLVLAGGDTSKYPLLVASLTVMGEVPRGRAVLRSGARPGDLLCASGTLGESELGLRLVLKKLHKQKRWAALVKKHFYPEPRLELGQWLADQRCATSMIDTSDGLSTDLGHICQASKVGAVVRASQLPVVRIPPGLAGREFNALKLALHGGEDYELLFTVPRKFVGRLPDNVGGVPISVIGEITKRKQVLLVDESGKSKPLRPGGWDPFRKR